MIKKNKVLVFSILLISGLILSGCTGLDNGNNDDGADGNVRANVDINDEKIAGSEAIEIGESPEEPKASLYFFWGDGCPHCASEKVFLGEMKEKYPDLEILMYETYKNPDNAKALQKMGKAYGVTVRGVPMTFIGDNKPMVGFSQRMEASLEARIKYCIENTCVDPASKL